jgi:DNA-binding beta-propeller fold protein YncE
VPEANPLVSMRVNAVNRLLILRFDLAGEVTVFADAGSGLVFPTDLAFDAGGNLFVANRPGSALTGNILRFDRSGTATVFADVSDGLADPQGLAFDDSASLFVANQAAQNILKFDPAGQPTVFATNLFFPDDLALDATGDLFVANLGAGQILRLDPAGSRTVFASGVAAQGLAFDAGGNLFVENQFVVDNMLHINVPRFNPTGTAAVFADLGPGISGAGGLAFQRSAIVPEPSTLMLLGFGLLILRTWQRRK